MRVCNTTRIVTSMHVVANGQSSIPAMNSRLMNSKNTKFSLVCHPTNILLKRILTVMALIRVINAVRLSHRLYGLAKLDEFTLMGQKSTILYEAHKNSCPILYEHNPLVYSPYRKLKLAHLRVSDCRNSQRWDGPPETHIFPMVPVGFISESYSRDTEM